MLLTPDGYPPDGKRVSLYIRDFLDMHISAQLVADEGSTFHGVLGQQNEEINILGEVSF